MIIMGNGVSINKNGTIIASGREIKPNLVAGTKDFSSGWTIGSLYTSSIDPVDGFTVLSISRTGRTSNSYARAVSPRIPYSVASGGILVSYLFKCDDYDAHDHKCICSINTYGSSSSTSRIGYFDPSYTTAAYVSHGELINGQWINFISYFDSNQVSNNRNATDQEVVEIEVSLNLSRNGSIHFKRPKIEVGTSFDEATPWCLNENDWGYIDRNNHGFVTEGDIMKMFDSQIQANDFIEW